jgi:hypothetical protein
VIVETAKELSAADHARLMLNTPETADKWIRIGEDQVLILHLGIGDLKRFEAAFEPIGKIYDEFVASNMPVADFIILNRDEIIRLQCEHAPKAAAIILGVTPAEARRIGSPLELLALVVAQWNHNLEIGQLAVLFPHPDGEDEEDGDNDGGPLATVERLMSAYHGMTYEAALQQTAPQIYLMGYSSAVAYKKLENKHEAERDTSKGKPAVGKKAKRGIFFEGKWYKRPKDMGAARYKRYLGQGMAAAYQDKGGGYSAMGG